MLTPLINESDDDIVIERVEPIETKDVPEVVRVPRIELAPRAADRSPVSQGRYWIYPPAIHEPKDTRYRHERSCWVQEVLPAKDFRLEPAADAVDSALLVTWIETVAPGKATIGGQRVTYRIGDETFAQEIPSKIVVVVREGKASPPPESQRKCVGVSRLLSPKT